MSRTKNQVQLMLMVITIVMFLFFSVFTKTFLSLSNIMAIIQKCVELGLLAIGMTMCLITGGINLSLAALCSFNTVIIAECSVNLGIPTPFALLIALTVSVLGGILNGYLIAYKKVAAMLATLGTQALFSGLGLVITNGSAISGLSKQYTYIGNGKLSGVVPVQSIILIAIVIIVYIFTKYTRTGRKMYLVGTNSNVAELSGINSARTVMIAYIMSSVMAFLAAMIISSRLASGRPDVVDGFLLPTIAAAMFGGASIDGGKGTIVGCILSVLVFSLLSNGLVHLLPRHAKFYEQIIIGLLLLTTLAMRKFDLTGKIKNYITRNKNKGVKLDEERNMAS